MKKILPFVLSSFLILSGCAPTAPAISVPVVIPHSTITIQNLPPISIDKPEIVVPDSHVIVKPNIIIKKVIIKVEPPKVNLIINNPIINNPVINTPIENPKVDFPPLPKINHIDDSQKDFAAKIIGYGGLSLLGFFLIIEYLLHRKRKKRYYG